MSIEEKEELENPTKYGWRFIGVFGSLCILNLVCAIDATILAVALPVSTITTQAITLSLSRTEQTFLQTISSSLNGSAIEAFWAGTSFLLTSAVFQPSWASFSHIIGRKPVLLASMGTFTAGTIIASLANNFTILLVGRSVQGIGGGGMVALTYVIVTDMVTLRERGKWFSLITLQWAIGSVSGPVIGGACSEKTNWYAQLHPIN
jgi:MFS family permease